VNGSNLLDKQSNSEIPQQLIFILCLPQEMSGNFKLQENFRALHNRFNLFKNLNFKLYVQIIEVVSFNIRFQPAPREWTNSTSLINFTEVDQDVAIFNYFWVMPLTDTSQTRVPTGKLGNVREFCFDWNLREFCFC